MRAHSVRKAYVVLIYVKLPMDHRYNVRHAIKDIKSDNRWYAQLGEVRNRVGRELKG